jgi:DNA-binding MarR family transcriptional regulator
LIGWAFLDSHNLNFSNRPVRTRTPGGVAGVSPIPYADGAADLDILGCRHCRQEASSPNHSGLNFLAMNSGADKAQPEPLDQESRVVAQDHTALKLWLRLLTCTTLIEASVGQRLRRRFGSTLPRFDLLAQLYRTPDGLRMSELSRRLMVTGGNVTGLADQLEQEGFLLREAVPGDRRAIRLRLTPDGQARFAEMASAHESWVVSLLSDLGAAEQRTLLALLGKLKTGLHEDAEPALLSHLSPAPDPEPTPAVRRARSGRSPGTPRARRSTASGES